ncbi:MAG: transporter substrate-binding domain-containing protein, partial [Cyanobacteria bacterium P01_H01_bin.105]
MGLLRRNALLRWMAMMVCGLWLTLVLPGVAQPQTLLMGTEADYVPFAYHQSTGGEPEEIIGFDIDVARSIADSLGVTLQIKEMPFDELLPALKSGELDFAIAAITPTDERQLQYDFSEPYFEVRHALVSPRLKPLRTVDDLRGHRMVVQQGSVQETEALRHLSEGFGIGIELFAVPTMTDMIAALKAGYADGALVEELVAQAYIEDEPDLVMDVLGELETTPVAIAFPQDSDLVGVFNK